MRFKKKIAKDEILGLPEFKFGGKVHVIAAPDEVPDAVNVLKGEQILGFDTETKPTFFKGQYFPTALVQLASKTEAFLFRINLIGPDPQLYTLLASPVVLKVGLALKDDLLDLKKLRQFEESGFIDMNEVGEQLGFLSIGVRNLSALILGKRINKAQQVTNWENKELTSAQIMYAATDAWVCREMYITLNSRGYLSGEAIQWIE